MNTPDYIIRTSNTRAGVDVIKKRCAAVTLKSKPCVCVCIEDKNISWCQLACAFTCGAAASSTATEAALAPAPPTLPYPTPPRQPLEASGPAPEHRGPSSLSLSVNNSSSRRPNAISGLFLTFFSKTRN